MSLSWGGRFYIRSFLRHMSIVFDTLPKKSLGNFYTIKIQDGNLLFLVPWLLSFPVQGSKHSVSPRVTELDNLTSMSRISVRLGYNQNLFQDFGDFFWSKEPWWMQHHKDSFHQLGRINTIVNLKCV